MRNLIFFLFFTNIALSQNLVLNGSFETLKGGWCPQNFNTYGRRGIAVENWTTPFKKATPDVLNSCCKSGVVNVPKNFAGYSEAYDGEGYMGIIIYRYINWGESHLDYVEYIEGEFISPLNNGKNYCVQLFYKLASNSRYASSGLGVLMSNKKLKSKEFEIIKGADFQINTLMENKETWNKLCFQYKAKGGEGYLTIGRFVTLDELVRDSLSVDNIKRRDIQEFAYFYIDNVSVTELKEGDCGCQQETLQTAKQDTVYLNKDLVVSLDDSLYINKLATKLKSQNNLKVQIFGTESERKKLIERLLLLGVRSDQVKEEDSANELKVRFSF